MLGVIAARRNQENVRRGLDNILKAHAERRFARAAEDVLAAGEIDHFGHPVSANVERLQPLQKRHARALRYFREGLLKVAKLRADLLQQAFGGAAVTSLLAHPQNVAPHVTEVLRRVVEDAYNDERLRKMMLDPPTVMGVEKIEVDTFSVRMVARTLPGVQFDVGRELRARVASAFRHEGINVWADLDTGRATGGAS